jgi:hypothetical protein
MPTPPRQTRDKQKKMFKVNTTECTCISYNCKHITTSIDTISNFAKSAKIILIQEHCLFAFELDSQSHRDNPISPIQRPREFGGVAIMWHADIDQQVQPLEDGGVRVQCIRLASLPRETLIVSVYMPARGAPGAEEEYLKY